MSAARPPSAAAIFRPEMLRYLERRTFGMPISLRVLPAWWSLLPLVGLSVLLAALGQLSYQRRLPVRIVAVAGDSVELDLGRAPPAALAPARAWRLETADGVARPLERPAAPPPATTTARLTVRAAAIAGAAAPLPGVPATLLVDTPLLPTLALP